MDAVHAAVAAALRRAESMLQRGISSHVLQQSVALATLRDALAAAGSMKERTFVGSIDGNITISVNSNVFSDLKEDGSTDDRPRKRRRCPHEEDVDTAIGRLRTQNTDISQKSLTAASNAILYLLKHLRGSNRETAIESWSFTTNVVESDKPKLILSVRLSPGIAVSLHTLVHSLGKASDGMITAASDGLQQKFNLPLHAEAETTEKHGQKSLTLFATIEEAGQAPR